MRKKTSAAASAQLAETQGATSAPLEPQVLDQQSASDTAPAVIEPPKLGRPSLYTQALADEICRRIGEGQGLTEICRDSHMPSASTVIGWSLRDEHGFFAAYARARDVKYELWSEQLVDIADDGSNDFMDRQSESGTVKVLNAEHVNRSRLRADTRKWLLSKLKPKTYGDHLEVGGSIDINVIGRRLEQLQAGRERARMAIESGDSTVIDITPEPSE